MSKEGKSRKPLIVGIIAALVVLALVVVLLLTQCTGGSTKEPDKSTEDTGSSAQTGISKSDIYWNVDKDEYAGKSEAGMSSREPEDDGYFHVRFFKDGEFMELRVADRKVINTLDTQSFVGLQFDADGIVTAVVTGEDLPIELVANQFYVVSVGGNLIKVNSSASFNGMEVLLEANDETGIYNMTGIGSEMGAVDTPISGDRIMGIANEEGELTHVFIYDRPNFMYSHEGECEHCKATVTWYEWTKTDAIPINGGHYQLMNDIQLKGQNSITANSEICIDLNGKRVDGKENARMWSLHNDGVKVAMMDTSAEKTGTFVAHGTGDQGLCVWLRYGQFYLYDGILDASDAATVKNGTTVALATATYMYMYGGKLIGGVSKFGYNADTDKYTYGLGGTMSLSGTAKFTFEDGEIVGGFAEAIVTGRDANGVANAYQRGLGGAIFMGGSSKIEMNGGVITGGIAGNLGGSIYMDSTAEFTLNGGVISGGRNLARGKNCGNVYVSSKATFIQNGGSILYGTSTNAGGNVYVNGLYIMNGGIIAEGRIVSADGVETFNKTSRNVFVVNGNFQQYGGGIHGGLQATSSSKKTPTQLFFSGYACVDDPDGSNINFGKTSGGQDPIVRIGTLRDGAHLSFRPTGLVTKPTAAENTDKCFSDSGLPVGWTPEGIVVGLAERCLCNSTDGNHTQACLDLWNGEKRAWYPWTQSDTMPQGDGNYYLITDVSTSSSYTVPSDTELTVDLNGHDIKVGSKSRAFSFLGKTGATLTITDSSTDNIEEMGRIYTSTGTASNQGMLIFTNNSGGNTFNFVGGVVDGSARTYTTDGGLIAVYGGANTVNIYGGKLIGATMGTNDSGTKRRGSIARMNTSGSVMNIYGGEIQCGDSQGKGSGLWMESSVELNIYGGHIYGGSRNGNPDDSAANIYSYQGKLNIYGGHIEGRVEAMSDTKSGEVYITGSPIIDSGKDGVHGLYLSSNGNYKTELTVENLGDNSNVKIGVTAGQAFGKADVAQADVDKLASYDSSLRVMKIDNTEFFDAADLGRMVLVDKDALYHCHCSATATASHKPGCDRKTYMWRPWDVAEEGHMPDVDGYFYLTGSAKTTATAYIENVDVHVDLNGMTTTLGDIRFWSALNRSNSNLTVTDTSAAQTGKCVVPSSDTKTDTARIWFTLSNTKTSQNNTLTVLAGTFDASQQGKEVNGGCGMFMLSGTNQVANIYGGTFIGAPMADTKTGSAFSVNNSCTLNLYGGTVTGGKVYEGAWGGGVYVNGGTVNLNGDVKITGNTVNNIGLKAGTLQIGSQGLGANAQFDILAANGAVIDEGLASYLTNTEAYTLEDWDGKLKIFTQEGAHIHCICGGTLQNGQKLSDGSVHTCKPVIFTEAPANFFELGGSSTSRNIYLTDDVDMKYTYSQKGGTANICLNGHTISRNDGNRPLSTVDSDDSQAGTINLTSCVAGGTVAAKSDAGKQNGGVIFLTNKGSVSMYGNVTIDGSQLNNKHTSSGGIIGCSTGTTFRMYGGTIKGGTHAGTGGVITITSASANFYMYDGTVTGGESAKSAGILYVEGGTFNMYDGTITGGKTGSGYNGGNVYVGTNGKFNMYDGTISDGTTSNNGGNVYVAGDGTFTMYDGTIKDGTASSYAGNVYVAKDGVFTMKKGTVSGGECVKNGGNVSVASGGTITMEDGKIIDGIAKDSGGNFNVNGTFTMEKGDIYGGTSKNANSADGMVVNGTLILKGGEIKGGITVNSNSSKATVKVSGDVVVGPKDGSNYGFRLANGSGQSLPIIEDAGLTSGASIVVSVNNSAAGLDMLPKVVTSGNITETSAAYFKTISTMVLTLKDGALELTAAPTE